MHGLLFLVYTIYYETPLEYETMEIRTFKICQTLSDRRKICKTIFNMNYQDIYTYLTIKSNTNKTQIVN